MKFLPKFLGLFVVGTTLALANETPSDKPIVEPEGKNLSKPAEKMGDKPIIEPKETLPVAPDGKKEIIENPTAHIKPDGTVKK